MVVVVERMVVEVVAKEVVGQEEAVTGAGV